MKLKHHLKVEIFVVIFTLSQTFSTSQPHRMIEIWYTYITYVISYKGTPEIKDTACPRCCYPIPVSAVKDKLLGSQPSKEALLSGGLHRDVFLQ